MARARLGQRTWRKKALLGDSRGNGRDPDVQVRNQHGLGVTAGSRVWGLLHGTAGLVGFVACCDDGLGFFSFSPFLYSCSILCVSDRVGFPTCPTITFSLPCPPRAADVLVSPLGHLSV